MTRAGGASARFRQRKLSTKQTLQILREDQVEKIDDDQPRNIPKVDTGVEKAEEIVSPSEVKVMLKIQTQNCRSSRAPVLGHVT